MAKEANEIYVRLNDKGTTFHDISTGQGVVADRVAKLKRSGTVTRAIKDKVLIEVDDTTAEAAIAKQEKEIQAINDRKNNTAPVAAVVAAPAKTPDLPLDPNKPADAAPAASQAADASNKDAAAAGDVPGAGADANAANTIAAKGK